MKPILAAVLLVLTLSACGGPSEEDVLTPDKIRASESAPVLPDIELSENPEPPPAPPAPVVEQPLLNEMDNGMLADPLAPVEEGAIPAAFRDRWGQSASDCGASEVVGNALVITGGSLRSGESVGRLQEVVGDYPERFTGIFEYDGQQREEQLVLTGSSNTLVRITNNQRAVYRRCSASRTTG